MKDKKPEQDPLIRFQGLEMVLSKAKEYLVDFKEGKIPFKLDDEERKLYEFVRGLPECKTEKLFLETKLATVIAVKEHFYKKENCRRGGHPGERVLSTDSSGKALCYCHTCGEMYDRRMNMEENRDFNKLMKTPMTI